MEKQLTPVEKVLEGIEKGYHRDREKWERFKEIYLLQEKIFIEMCILDAIKKEINSSKENIKPEK